MDFETTGLFDDGHNNPLTNPNRSNETARERAQRLDNLIKSDGNRFPKITEMAYMSVPRVLFLEGTEQMSARHLSSMSQDGEEGIEPVQVVTNVHVRQLNPQLNDKERFKYEELQRKVPSVLLKQSDLTCKCTFAQEWPGVVHLLQTVPKPACLVAHNGLNFDFRILCHELRKSDLFRTHPIPEQVYFLDTLSCFYELEKEYNREIELTMENVDWTLVLSQFQPNSETVVATAEIEETVQQNCTASEGTQNSNGHKSTTVLHRLTVLQETPTKKTELISVPKTTAKRSLFDEDVHPIQFMRKTHWSPAKRRCIDAKFFESNNRGEWNFNGNHARRLLCGRGNFKLENMFKRFFSIAPQFHRAQSDCEALLQVCLSYGMDFVKFVDRSCSSFPDCFYTSSKKTQTLNSLNTDL
ncbi:hypothetical protein niasHS_007403 [Heterodera schachtii]|uniref:Three prime repair exonuclease 1 n=1 Tax=Heterodera schachtii TaxID=97005 RepID=A0ABD2JY11_HETSC